MTVATMVDQAGASARLSDILQNYSAEVTSRDKKSMDVAGDVLPKGTELFIASLPGDTAESLVAASIQLRKAGLTPVPHIVARNTPNRAFLDDLLGRLVGEAGVDRILSLGGDRDKPEGEFDSSLQLIETGLYQKHGIQKIRIGCYPEGHPRISDAVLEDARAAKLAAAEKAGLDVTLISQFCFDADPIVALAQRMRAQGVKAPFRVGVAGPANRGTLVKYALICGVGPSLRALKERHDLAAHVIAGETPEALLTKLAAEQAARPELGISGIHFFTFGSLAKTAEWAEARRR